eukprot:TRINITY_DN2356_c0_g1_i3.p3 TRINITY_DN2356_c0_g1~~TRINITY_DN2356_c0_g1_i3.p3  ORF type:complete len:172 (-),score=10.82 TRINITY_DN2356_c0_g1_i3:37-552(-)
MYEKLNQLNFGFKIAPLSPMQKLTFTKNAHTVFFGNIILEQQNLNDIICLDLSQVWDQDSPQIFEDCIFFFEWHIKKGINKWKIQLQSKYLMFQLSLEDMKLLFFELFCIQLRENCAKIFSLVIQLFMVWLAYRYWLKREENGFDNSTISQGGFNLVSILDLVVCFKQQDH